MIPVPVSAVTSVGSFASLCQVTCDILYRRSGSIEIETHRRNALLTRDGQRGERVSGTPRKQVAMKATMKKRKTPDPVWFNFNLNMVHAHLHGKFRI